MAHWNSGERCDACHHAKWSECSVMELSDRIKSLYNVAPSFVKIGLLLGMFK